MFPAMRDVDDVVSTNRVFLSFTLSLYVCLASTLAPFVHILSSVVVVLSSRVCVCLSKLSSSSATSFIDSVLFKFSIITHVV